ncbi:SHOCT domain-containing protein [Neisseria yangbaofengii]|uniref:SHOCT domain-containing protein n=1 Tax=Neisseria yangbaofengii TaxID=2709396 RepID=UPI00197F22C0|nr:SHOCT domain-containing protein [Neisseria yangbaofengii]
MDNRNIIGELEKLAELRDKGILTDAEFQVEKAKLLNGKPEAANTEETETKAKPHEPSPSIVIQSSTSAQSVAAAAAKSKSWGVLSTIGACVVVLLGLGFCASFSDSDKAKKADVAEVRAVDDTQTELSKEKMQELEAMDEANHQARIMQAKAYAEDAEIAFNQADQRLKKVWSDLDNDVRAHLKKEQIAWNRSKESTCEQVAKDSDGIDDEARGARFECLTEWTNKRVPELVEKEKEIAQRVAGAKAAALEKSAEAEMSALMGEFQSLPQEVAQTFNGGNSLESWFDETEKRCTREEKSHVDSVKAAAAGWQCVIDAVKAKREELKGYQI